MSNAVLDVAGSQVIFCIGRWLLFVLGNSPEVISQPSGRPRLLSCATNENTNGLLRQYFPKGVSLATVTQDELDAVADELNGRPRQTLGFATPTQVYNKAVASIT